MAKQKVANIDLFYCMVQIRWSKDIFALCDCQNLANFKIIFKEKIHLPTINCLMIDIFMFHYM